LPGGAGTYTVVDNGANDTNSTVGQIGVANIGLGTYTSTDTGPHPSYLHNPYPALTLTITAAAPNVALGTMGSNDTNDHHDPLSSVAWEKRDAGGNFEALAVALHAALPISLPGGAGTYTVVDNGSNDTNSTVGQIGVANIGLGT